ncbi:hypothetical protein EDD17DRAFT_1660722 [Pisolithus thermaeus]|nr:hypothetical protein EDD17DRAFT_1660722 [Pisolithus thermaeus]
MLCWAITVTFHTSPCLFPCSSSDGENTEKAYFVLPIELFHRNMFKAFGGRSRSAEGWGSICAARTKFNIRRWS